jgi:stage II sporulation protein GA (sporulation sigma-E factor processing peptidase)
MVIDVYADVVFLVNFFVNGAVLWLCNALLRRRAKAWRVLLGAAVCALFYTLLLFSELREFFNVFTSFVVLAPGILTTFGFSAFGLKGFFVNLGAAYICVFAIGGLATVIAGNVGIVEIAVFLAVVSAFAGIRFLRIHMIGKMLDKKSFCDVKVYLGDLCVNVRGLVDTGNSLVEPISQKPVIVAELAAIRDLLPPAVNAMYDNGSQNDLEIVARSFVEANLQNRIRMIPFKSLGNVNGVLIGFRPDKVVVSGNLGSGHLDSRCLDSRYSDSRYLDSRYLDSESDAIIGICDFKLSKDGEYQALVNPVLL